MVFPVPAGRVAVFSALGLIASAVVAPVSAAVAPIAAEAPGAGSSRALPAVPRDPVRTAVQLVAPSDSGVVAWTGTGSDVRAAQYPDRAAAERAGLTPFVFEPTTGGFGRFRVDDGADDPRCLGLQRTPSRALAVGADLAACDAPSGSWTVDAGTIRSAAGPTVTNRLVVGSDGIGTGATWNDSATADFGLSIDSVPAVAAAQFDVTPPKFNRPESQAVVSGRTEPGSTIEVTDERGASLVGGPVTAGSDGTWRASLITPADGEPNVRFLVSVTSGASLTARSWGTVAYGVGISLDGPVGWLGTDGKVRVTGQGDPSADVVDVNTGTVTRVRADGAFTIDFRPRNTTTASTVELAMRGLGGFLTRVPVDVRKAVFDVTPVFPSDEGQDAYIDGDGVPGAVVTAFADDGREVGTATVDDDGHVELDLDAPDAAGVQRVRLEQVVDEHVLSEASFSIDYGAAVAITSPRADDTVDADTVVRGTGEPGAAVDVELDGRVLHTVVETDGTWSGKLADPTSLPFAVLSPRTSTRFTDENKPAIFGTGIPGMRVVFNTAASGPTRTVSTTVRPDGSWRFDGAALPIEQSESYRAVVSQGPAAAGTTETIPVQLTGDVRPLVVTAPADGATISPVNGAVDLNGTGTPGDTIRTDGPDGHEYRTVVRADGKWMFRGVRLASGARSVTVAGATGERTVSVTVAAGVGDALSIISPRQTSVVAPEDGLPSATVRSAGAARGGIGALTDVRGGGRTVGFVVDAYGGWHRTIRLGSADASELQAVTATDAPASVRFVTQVAPSR